MGHVEDMKMVLFKIQILQLIVFYNKKRLKKDFTFTVNETKERFLIGLQHMLIFSNMICNMLKLRIRKSRMNFSIYSGKFLLY